MTTDISVDKLRYSYPPLTRGADPIPVLRGVSFEVARGEFVALLSRVGAGKSTLCMALDGLVPHATGGVFGGDVTVVGLNTKRYAVADLARYVGIVFQDPESQLVQMRVEDEVAFGLENLGVPSPEIEERVSWALAAVGLEAYRGRSPLMLSGGEKQRVAIASMLAMQPQVLVLDEPTGSLDPAGKAAVFNVLARLRRQHQMTIFMATQELERAGRFADRVLVLHEGQIALDGPPGDVFQHVAELQEMGIGVPQVAELAAQLSRRTGRRYVFTSSAEAYKQLRRRARKSHMHKAHPTPAPPPAPRPKPFADRAQISVENVSYTYDDGTPALREVNLVLHPGDFLALLGPNGAGKTTLAKHFNALLKPGQGRVLVEKEDTARTSVAALSRMVGYAFQNPDHQIFAPTVAEEIAFGPRMQELPAAIVAQRVAEVLDRFHLVACADMPPALLGFGQRRKVALAAVIAMQPKVLILDEPTGGLDWRSRQELLEVVAAFHGQGRSVVLITHDMRLVAEYTTRAIVMSEGRVRFDGATRDLFRQPEILKQAQLALPPVARLARRLRGHGLPEDLLTTDEFATAWLARVGVRQKRKKARHAASKG